MPSRRLAGVGFGVTEMAACRAEALSKIYGRRDTAVHALRDITLSIPPHAFTAIMGPSGSGKSTLLHCLAALDTPTSGRVFLGQTELTALSRRQQAQVRRDRIGFVFQAFNLVPTLDAIENITLPQLLAGRRPNREWLEYVVARIGLADRLHHRPSQLSGGQQQRVALARALAGQPEVIFADEPTGNLDTRASREMMALLRSAVDDFRQTVVTVTHDPAIAGYADQVLFFTDGQVVDQVVHPEPDLVLEHLQYLDFSTPVHRETRRQWGASMQRDGQDMRSRRRRRGDETGPGRPMVGSDDEVEVARQERWLQRIREQFENEHEAAHARDAYDTANVHHPDATQHMGDGYDTANGYDSDTTRHLANGYHPDATHHSANGYDTGYQPDTAHPTANGYDTGYQPDTAHPAGNGYDTGYQPDTAHHTGNGFRADATQRMGNGHAGTPAVGAVADEGWLPPERSWLTDPAAAGADLHATGRQPSVEQTWSQPLPAEARPAGAASAPQADTQWSTGDWNGREQGTSEDLHPAAASHTAEPATWNPGTVRQDEWTTGDPYTDSGVWGPPAQPAEPPAPADPSPVTPIDSWRESRTREPADDVWSAPEPQEGWSTITPSEPTTGRWDATGGPDRNGWQPQTAEPPAEPPAPAPAPPPAATNGDGRWQQWRSEPPAPEVAPPGANGRHHTGPHELPSREPHGGFAASDGPQLPAAYNEYRNGRQAAAEQLAPRRQPAAGQHEPEPHDSEPLHAPRRQSVRDDASTPPMGEPAVEVREIRPTEPSAGEWDAPGDDRVEAVDQPRSEIVDPVRELLDIWSPNGTGEHDLSPEQPAAATSNGDFGGGPQDVAASFGSAPVQRGTADQPFPLAEDDWHTDAARPADRDPYAPRSSESYSGITTDPFEALQSLQSQLNRLGGGRRAPRRYEE